MFAARISGLIAAVVLIVGCGLAAGLLHFGGNELRPGYNEYSVPMVDPSGQDAEQDLIFSHANLNNSQANLNNAEAEKFLAQATAIVADSIYSDPLYVHKSITSETGAAFNQGMLFVVGAIFVFVFGFVAMGMFGNRNGGQEENRSLSRR